MTAVEKLIYMELKLVKIVKDEIMKVFNKFCERQMHFFIFWITIFAKTTVKYFLQLMKRMIQRSWILMLLSLHESFRHLYCHVSCMKAAKYVLHVTLWQLLIPSILASSPSRWSVIDPFSGGRWLEPGRVRSSNMWWGQIWTSPCLHELLVGF